MKKGFYTTLMAVLLAFLFCTTAFAANFSDVPDSFWASTEIGWVFDKGLMNGTTATTFNPRGQTLRGQMTAILYRYAGSPAVEGASVYSDVPSGKYYYNASIWAVKNAIMEETRLVSKTMDANDPISRAEFCTMLLMFSIYSDTYAAPDADIPFTDVGNVSSTTEQAIRWAYHNGIVNGTSETTFNPTGTLTRAAAAAMLYRYENYVNTKPQETTPTENTTGNNPSSGNTSSGGGSSVTVPTHSETGKNLVWVPTNGGTKYHTHSGCSQMIDPIQVTIETAKANGYTACGRCH